MKNLPYESIKNFLRDRTLVTLAAIVIVMCIVYFIYVAIALEPSDLQVATRYTAFGDTNFYRNKWFYLLSFIAFGGIITALHIALAIKLYGRSQRQLAIALLGFTAGTFIIVWIITRSVLQIAFL